MSSLREEFKARAKAKRAAWAEEADKEKKARDAENSMRFEKLPEIVEVHLSPASGMFFAEGVRVRFTNLRDRDAQKWETMGRDGPGRGAVAHRSRAMVARDLLKPAEYLG